MNEWTKWGKTKYMEPIRDLENPPKKKPGPKPKHMIVPVVDTSTVAPLKKGNPVSPIYQQLFEKAVTTNDWVEIINKAKEQAIAGDKGAREWLAQYMVIPIYKMQENNAPKEKTINVIYFEKPLPEPRKDFLDISLSKETEWEKP